MNLLRAASTISLFTLASRITGLIRDIVVSSVFGAGASFDAFNVAFRIPNLLRRLFAEGAFSQAFVPTLARTRAADGDAATERLADAVATVLFAVRDNVVRAIATGSDVPPLVAVPVSLLAAVATVALYLALTRRGAWLHGYGAAVRTFAPAGVIFGLSYALLFEAYYHGRVSVVAPLVATESLWGVAFAALFLRRSELVGRRLVLGAVLIVAGGVVIGLSR